jgi:hypothetical protein
VVAIKFFVGIKIAKNLSVGDAYNSIILQHNVMIT